MGFRTFVIAAIITSATTLAGPPAGAAVTNPDALCGDADAVTVLYTHPSLGWTKPITRRTATHGGCASAWATGELTAAAIAKQCLDVLSQLFPFAPYGYEIEDMGDCIRVMGALSRGELDPGPVDPFPYG